MTSASRSHDAIETAERIREQMRIHVEAMEVLTGKLKAAELRTELELVLVDAASLLREISTNRNVSEGQRLRCQGIRDRIARVRSA